MASWILLHITYIFVHQISGISSAAVSCVGESGQQVDWFIVYKLPRIKESTHDYVTQGLGYVYLDSKAKNFTMSDHSINSTMSAVGQTLQQIYQVHDLGYIMYNDEDPAGHQCLSLGHTKGDLAFDNTSGFWLIHSVPKFPPNDSYHYPETGTRYGQSFLCVTFDYLTFNEIGLQLLYNGPQIYDKYLPDNLASGVPYIKKAIDGKFMTTKPYERVTKLQSMGSITYISFAKSKFFGSDLYSDMVAPYYNANLLVETWQNGVGKLPSNCSELTVENVLDMKLSGDPFKETTDHSKWAISKSSEQGLVCIGDINRMKSQFKRGGGTLCTNNVDIWEAFRAGITSIDSCQKQTLFSLLNAIHI